MSKVTFRSPFFHFKGNLAYANSGDIVKCYKVDLVETYSLGEEQFDNLFGNWYRAFKNLPHMVIVKQDVCTKKYYDTSLWPEETFLQRNDKAFFQGKEYMHHECYLFFVYTESKTILKNENIHNPFKALPKPKEVFEDVKKVNEIFVREVEQVVEFLNASKQIYLTPILEKEIQSYSRSYFNAFYPDRNTDTKNQGRYFQIGDKIVGSYVIKSSKQLPQSISNVVVDSKMSSTDFKFYRGFADCLNLELKFDHVYTQIFFMEGHKELKESIQKNRDTMFGFRGFSPENKSGAKKLEEYLEQMSNDESIRLIRAHFNVSFFADNEEALKVIDNSLSKTFKQMDIVPYYPVGNNLANIFNNSFCSHASRMDADNTFVIDLQQAICLLNNTTNYKSDEEGVYFNDRIFNIPTKKDIWDAKKKRLKARNFFIMAPTGNGKSVLYAHISRQLRENYERGYVQVINDCGDSYWKLIALFPKEETLYVKFEEGRPLGINTFYISPGARLTTTHNNQIVGFASLLWKRNDHLDTEEEVSLRKIVQCYYDNVEEGHNFPSFYQFINLNKNTLLEELEIEYQHFHIDEFLHNCSEFVGNGAYAFLFKETKTINYDLSKKKVVVFEFDKAKDDPLLLSVLLLISSDVTRRLCWEDKSTRGYIFFDEFAKLLKFPNVLTSVQYQYQAARKQECAVGIVLQTPNQLPENDTANSIIENTQVIYVLENTKGYKPIKDRFNMSSHALNQMMSIKSNFTGSTRYSEFYLQLENEGNVMRLHLPPDNLLAYETEGADNTKIMGYYEQTENMELALEMFKSNR